MDGGLLSIISAGHGQLVKMLITLELHGIFGSNFAYLFILTSYFYKLQEAIESNTIVYMGRSCKQVSLSRDITQSSKKNAQTISMILKMNYTTIVSAL